MSWLSLAWNPDVGGAVIALATFTGAYLLYWFVAHASLLKDFCEKRFRGERSQTMHVLLQRGIGIVSLGVPTVVVTILLPQVRFRDLGVTVIESMSTVYWILGFSAVLVPVVFSFSRKPGFYTTYPLIRQRVWNVPLVVVNTLSWCVYLLAYEFIFRGFLLGLCSRTLGAWPGILITTALYVCVHIPYGFWVTFGALPLGITMCVATVHTGNIWTAYAAHLVVALLNDYVALAANPRTRVRVR